MQISLNWLNDYIAIKDLPISQLCETLTNLGLEVESVQTITPIQGNLVVGKILETSRHPNAENLTLCQVDIGGNQPLRIVCGAPNARTGIQVAVATVGCVLPGDIKIKPAKIRGEASEGMLCSEEELGIGTGSDGIIELPPDLKLGSSVTAYYGLEDVALTIGLTPNRTDCLGYMGLARDLAAKLDRPLCTPKVDEACFTGKTATSEKVKVALENPKDCGRFTALFIQDVKAVPSPSWMRQRLETSGMRPINLLVDVTNYIMLENSHPIHAYDARHLRASSFIVRRAKSGESLLTLDETSRSLTPEDLLICDGEGPIGLAGVMGGQTSEVKDDTQNLVLEVAHFNPSLVRKTSKRMALHTEASHRFERGVDITQTTQVAKRFATLLHQCCIELRNKGLDVPIPSASPSPLDVYPNPRPQSRVSLRLSRARAIMGLPELTKEQCVSTLERLGCKAADSASDSMTFEIPTWRLDIEKEIDLIEEISRVMGFEKIPYTLPAMNIKPIPEHGFIDFCDQARISMASCGFAETISFPFVSVADLDHLHLPALHPFRSNVALANPLSEDQALLQPTLLANLIRAVAKNRRHGDQGSRLFEVARCFYDFKHTPMDPDFSTWEHLPQQGFHIPSKAVNDERPTERTMIAGIIDQPWQSKSWRSTEVPATFFHGKDVIARWLRNFSLTEITFKPVDSHQMPWLHPGAAAAVFADEIYLGFLGEIHPRVARKFDIETELTPVVFELDMEHVYKTSELVTRQYITPAERFPAVSRDLAFVVNLNTTHAAFDTAFRDFKRKRNMQHWRLFDVYTGPNLPDDKKSMAYSVSFKSPKRTLTDKEVDEELTMLVDWIKQSLSAEQR